MLKMNGVDKVVAINAKCCKELGEAIVAAKDT